MVAIEADPFMVEDVVEEGFIIVLKQPLLTQPSTTLPLLVTNAENKGILLPTVPPLLSALVKVIAVLLASAHVPRPQHENMQPLPRKGDLVLTLTPIPVPPALQAIPGALV